MNFLQKWVRPAVTLSSKTIVTDIIVCTVEGSYNEKGRLNIPTTWLQVKMRLEYVNKKLNTATSTLSLSWWTEFWEVILKPHWYYWPEANMKSGGNHPHVRAATPIIGLPQKWCARPTYTSRFCGCLRSRSAYRSYIGRVVPGRTYNGKNRAGGISTR